MERRYIFTSSHLKIVQMMHIKERCESLGIQVELHPFLVSDYMNRSIDQHADIIFMGEVFAADRELHS